MRLRTFHRWDLSVAEAREVQERLARRVRQSPLRKPVELIAGTDVSYDAARGIFVAGGVILRAGNFETVEEKTAEGRTPFPYVPGFLSFREIPPLAKALKKVRNLVDLLLV